MITTQDSHFNTVISNIQNQLENNKELIQKADVVFICGGSNTCLTSTALLVGNMINLFKNEQTDITTRRTSVSPLTIINSEMYTNDLITLGYNIGLPLETKFLHIFDTDYEKLDFQSPIDKSNITTLLKRSTCVIVDNVKYEPSVNHVMRHKLFDVELTGVYVQVMRLSSKHWLDHEDEINVLQNKFSPTGLKVVFIETAKTKKTGIVDLIFHTRSN